MIVSVWSGNTPSWEELDGELTFSFTVDGDAIPCGFCVGFNFDWFDEDYREASHSETETLNIRELLKGHTDGDQIADALGEKGILNFPCNSIIIIYNFAYSGAVKCAKVGAESSFCFLGCVEITTGF